MVNHTGNSKIEIRENEEFQLECLVKNSKPVAKIVWYRGQVELKLGNYDYDYNVDTNVCSTIKNPNSVPLKKTVMLEVGRCGVYSLAGINGEIRQG